MKSNLTMRHPSETESLKSPSRRHFVQSSLAMGVGLTSGLPLSQTVHAAGSDVLKIGLVGCGDRGRGAAVNALNADKNTRLTAMADLFPDNIRVSRGLVQAEKGSQVAVADDHCFSGFDGYKKVIESGVDVVLLALPTFFHPHYVKACINAGKHVFCEKIHAVDAPGVHMILAAAEQARRNNLCLVSGLAWRYDAGVQETMKRVHDGALGDIIAIQEMCNTGSLRSRARQPDWTEMQYQIQDWFNFFWLSCDLPGLNLVHNLDKAAWAMQDEPPVRCWGTGGRQTRMGPMFGDAWDHFAVVFEYAKGTRLFAYARQQNGCETEISDRFLGTRGRCDLLRYRIEGQTNWRYSGPPCNRFDLEHQALFSAIRRAQPINNGLYMARSSMMAIMATWACYTGQVITWEQAMASKHVRAPKVLALDAEPPTKPDSQGNYPLPTPGVTKFV